ncbi:MAG: hypothetical protein ABSC64_21825 [Candidatus Korobacteraceae bacterium]|jgi:hypothetical protein
MQRMFLVFSLALFVIVSLTRFVTGQDAKGSGSSNAADQNARTLTGCLQKGANANEFNLQAEDGGLWRVKGDSTQLALQVGHAVTLSGDTSSAETQSDETSVAADENAKVAHSNRHQITVTNLVQVSDGCQNDLKAIAPNLLYK